MLLASPSIPSSKSSEDKSGVSSAADRLQDVVKRIRAAEIRSGRAPNSVTLIAVSKTKPSGEILNVAAQGVVDFGENYVQEATRKIEKIKNHYPNLKWHLIGSLQTNKSKFVVGKFATIQSVDRIELAKALDKRAEESGIVQDILLQVKLGDEPTKSGVTPQALPELIKKIVELKSVRIMGLMSLPPMEAEAESSRNYFRSLRELRDNNKYLVQADKGQLHHLSMGTTHDFEVAIEEGATMVRVGTAIFGERHLFLKE